jgi:hypothetical protein
MEGFQNPAKNIATASLNDDCRFNSLMLFFIVGLQVKITLDAGVRELKAGIIHSFIGMEVQSGMVTRHCERPWV